MIQVQHTAETSPDFATLFKSACESCSKAKTKCSGGNPCSGCKKREIPCIYVVKRKRGPKPHSEKRNSVSKRVKQGFMSTYEKRIWSVFFTIFKNQKRTAKENPFSWNWFVLQLCRLDNYVELAQTDKGKRMREVLNSFYRSLDIDRGNLCSGVKSPCPIPPHLCNQCASSVFDVSTALPAPNKETLKDHYSAKLKLQNSKQRFWDDWKSTSFDATFDNNSKACLIYETNDDSFGVFVNAKFQETFGYDDDGMTKLLLWSAGGFLPWGADVLGALLVYESDLLVFLKVMATKYQAQGDLASKADELKNRFVNSLDSSEFGNHHDHHLNGNDEFEEQVVPALNDFTCWASCKHPSQNPCKDLREVKQSLKPRRVQFITNVRLRKRKNVHHKVFMRFELMCLDDVVAAPTSSVEQGTFPARVTHSEPFVNAPLGRRQRSTAVDTAIWPKSIPSNPRFPTSLKTEPMLQPQPVVKTTYRTQSTQSAPVVTSRDPLEHLFPENVSDYFVEWDFPVKSEGTNGNVSDDLTLPTAGSVRSGRQGQGERVDRLDVTSVCDGIDNALDRVADVDESWLQGLISWAEQ